MKVKLSDSGPENGSKIHVTACATDTCTRNKPHFHYWVRAIDSKGLTNATLSRQKQDKK